MNKLFVIDNYSEVSNISRINVILDLFVNISNVLLPKIRSFGIHEVTDF